jgi:hypothetical protein
MAKVMTPYGATGLWRQLHATLRRGGLPSRDQVTRWPSLPAISCETVVLPGERAVIRVEWNRSIEAVRAALRCRMPLALLPAVEGIPVALMRSGTLADIEDWRTDEEDGTYKIWVQGRATARVSLLRGVPYLQVEAVESPTWHGDDPRWVRDVEELFSQLRQRASATPRFARGDTCSYHSLGYEQLVIALAEWLLPRGGDRHLLLVGDLRTRLQMLWQELARRTEGQVERHPAEEHEAESEDAASPALPDTVRRAITEYEKLGTRSAAEAVGFLTEMKWLAPEPKEIDPRAARAQLDGHCYGMERVKSSVVRTIAMLEWSRRTTGSHRGAGGKVLCLVGPPGVGKTAIAAGVAAAMGRELRTIPMGGVDDLTLAGCAQSYSRSQPGLIARTIRDSGRHPRELVILLDEIDKVAKDHRSAIPVLLALLDPVQHGAWRDLFLDKAPLDLSQMVFVCTANDLKSIADPLLDRLQPISLPAYTRDEHIAIAWEHSLPRLRAEKRITEEVGLAMDVVETLVDNTPSSPGMRQLNHQLETVLETGIMRHQECGENVWVTAEMALAWVKEDAEAEVEVEKEEPQRRPIGFRIPSSETR